MFYQSIPIATMREYIFRLQNVGGVAISGATFSGAEIQIRKAGEADFTNVANSASVTELGSKGLYVYLCSLSEINTPGVLMFRVNKAGAILIEEKEYVERAVFGTVAAGTLTSTSFTTDLAQADGHWDGVVISFLTGALAGQVKKIGAFLNAGGLVTLAGSSTLTAAPSAGDVFQLLTR